MKIRNLTIYAAFVCAFALPKAGYSQTDEPRRLFLQIHQVTAVRECRGILGSTGADEIDLGAVAIDPVGGVRARTLDLGKFGHDGSTKRFRPPRDWIMFKIAGGKFPKVSQVILVLAERDIGSGFGKYLDKLVSDVKAKAKASGVASAVSRPGHLSAGFLQSGEKDDELKKEIAERLGKALENAARKFATDDIFPAARRSLTVTAKNFRFPNGKLTSAPEEVRFRKDKCDYSVTYSWRLSQ